MLGNVAGVINSSHMRNLNLSLRKSLIEQYEEKKNSLCEIKIKLTLDTFRETPNMSWRGLEHSVGVNCRRLLRNQFAIIVSAFRLRLAKLVD